MKKCEIKLECIRNGRRLVTNDVKEIFNEIIYFQDFAKIGDIMTIKKIGEE